MKAPECAAHDIASVTKSVSTLVGIAVDHSLRTDSGSVAMTH